MSLFPFMRSETDAFEDKPITYKEYDFDFTNNQLTGKVLEEKEALKVWIYKALFTQRYIFPAYSWDYGQDLDELIGQAYELDYIKSEVERRVQECLLINEHITRCHSFDINLTNDTLRITFTVDTAFGEEAIDVTNNFI